MDIGQEFAYNHATPQRGSLLGGEINHMAKKLKKSKKIAPKRSLKVLLEKV
jgi:hypothetical protein